MTSPWLPRLDWWPNASISFPSSCVSTCCIHAAIGSLYAELSLPKTYDSTPLWNRFMLDSTHLSGNGLSLVYVSQSTSSVSPFFPTLSMNCCLYSSSLTFAAVSSSPGYS